METKFKAVILAGGKSTRFAYDIPKPIYPLGGKPMIQYTLDLANASSDSGTIVVVGYKRNQVKALIKQQDVQLVIQKQQLGTGHAVAISKNAWKSFSGYIIILYADNPLIRESTLQKAKKYVIAMQKESGVKFTGVVLTAKVKNPFSYGRIIKKGKIIQAIVEEKDANNLQKKIKEVNSGLYILKAKHLSSFIDKIQNNNTQKEFLLTDIVKFSYASGYIIHAFVVDDPDEIQGINTVKELNRAEKILKSRSKS